MGGRYAVIGHRPEIRSKSSDQVNVDNWMRLNPSGRATATSLVEKYLKSKKEKDGKR